MKGGWVVQFLYPCGRLNLKMGQPQGPTVHCAIRCVVLDPKGQRRNPMSSGLCLQVHASHSLKWQQAFAELCPTTQVIVTSQFMQALLNRQTKCYCMLTTWQSHLSMGWHQTQTVLFEVLFELGTRLCLPPQGAKHHEGWVGGSILCSLVVA